MKDLVDMFAATPLALTRPCPLCGFTCRGDICTECTSDMVDRAVYNDYMAVWAVSLDYKRIVERSK